MITFWEKNHLRIRWVWAVRNFGPMIKHRPGGGGGQVPITAKGREMDMWLLLETNMNLYMRNPAAELHLILTLTNSTSLRY